MIRILNPNDYGLFAMTQVILVLPNMLNGYAQASGLTRQKEIGSCEIRQLVVMPALLNCSLESPQFVLAPSPRPITGRRSAPTCSERRRSAI